MNREAVVGVLYVRVGYCNAMELWAAKARGTLEYLDITLQCLRII